MNMPIEYNTRNLIDPGPSERGSHTSMTLLLCLRKHAILKEIPMDWGSNPMRLGSLTHLALAHAVCNQHGIAGPLDWTDAIDVWQDQEQWWAQPAEIGWLSQVVPTALAELNVQYPGWKPVAVERCIKANIVPDADWEWARDIRDGVLHTQRLDLAFEWGGQVFFLDWKTTYALRDRTLEEHYLSLQMISAAFLGFQMFGQKFGGVLVARLAKLAAGKTAGTVVIDTLPGIPAAVEDFPLTVCWAAQQEAMLEGRPWREWPPSFVPAACMGLYGPKSKCMGHAACGHGICELS